jgi:transposase
MFSIALYRQDGIGDAHQETPSPSAYMSPDSTTRVTFRMGSDRLPYRAEIARRERFISPMSLSLTHYRSRSANATIFSPSSRRSRNTACEYILALLLGIAGIAVAALRSCSCNPNTSQPLLARRARVVLASAEGLDNESVARKLRCSVGMVGKWRARFLKDGLDGLYDEPRPGAPRRVNDAQMERVIVQTLESTPRGQTHWSTRELANATGLSRMTISRIWQAFGLQPHRTEKLQPFA